MTSAIERLRELLDERGVFWVDIPRKDMTRTVWKERDGQLGYCYFDENEYGVTQLAVTGITPEQAIAATLGSCNCSNNCTKGERTETCHVESSIIDTYEYNRWEYELSCGHTIIWEDSEPPNYCPICGRRIEQ